MLIFTLAFGGKRSYRHVTRALLPLVSLLLLSLGFYQYRFPFVRLTPRFFSEFWSRREISCSAIKTEFLPMLITFNSSLIVRRSIDLGLLQFRVDSIFVKFQITYFDLSKNEMITNREFLICNLRLFFNMDLWLTMKKLNDDVVKPCFELYAAPAFSLFLFLSFFPYAAFSAQDRTVENVTITSNVRRAWERDANIVSSLCASTNCRSEVYIEIYNKNTSEKSENRSVLFFYNFFSGFDSQRIVRKYSIRNTSAKSVLCESAFCILRQSLTRGDGTVD